MTAIQPIETTYKGCRFRSRLEARWAVLFDALGIQWVYEPQGFMVTDGLGAQPVAYLPDFHLPRHRLWVEVKGHLTTDDLKQLCYAALDDRGGLPWDPDGTPVTDADRNALRLLVLSDIPSPSHNSRPAHLGLRFHKGSVWARDVHFDSGGQILEVPDGFAIPLYADDDGYLDDVVAVEVQRANDGVRRVGTPPSVAVNRAYVAARSARFEHDERERW